MLKISFAIGLILLVAALSVFGSPFFAALFVVPALIIYFVIAGGGFGLTGDEGGGKLDAESRPWDHPPGKAPE